MPLLSKQVPARNFLQIVNTPGFIKFRQRVGEWKPVRFLINVWADYRSVGRDWWLDAKAHRRRSALLATGLIIAFVAHRLNPSENHFRDGILNNNNDLIQVSSYSRSPRAEAYLVNVQRLSSADRLDFYSLGLFSLVLRRDFNTSCDLYEARCKYLAPPLEKFADRVVDVGVFGRWIWLEKAMKDFDVNADD